MTLGDGQKYVAALIQIEYETTSDWAQRKKLPHTSYADLVDKDEVRTLIASEIDRLNEQLARVVTHGRATAAGGHSRKHH